METLRTGEGLDGVVMGVQHPGGARRWISINTRLVDWAGERGVVATFHDITEQRALQRKLSDDNEVLRATGALARIGHWTQLDEGLVELSQPLQTMLGLPEQKVEVEGLLQSFEQDTAVRLEALLKALPSQATEVESIVQGHLRAKGGREPVELVVRVKRTADGGTLGLVQDITQLQELRRAVADAQALHALAVEGAKLGTWEWVVTEDSVTVNPYWCTMLGIPVSERVSFEVWSGVLHPDDRDRILGIIAAHLEDESVPLLYEYRIRHARGHWSHLYSAGRVTERGEDGAPLRVSGINLDITDWRVAEVRAEKARVALDALEQSVVQLTDDGRVLAANEAARDLFGLDAPSEVSFEPAEVAEPFGNRLQIYGVDDAELADALQGNKLWEGDLRLRKGAEERVLHAKLVRDEAHGAQRTLVLTDVTEQREAWSSGLTDPLTGLGNRRSFDASLARAIERGEPFAVVFIDLDRFKPVNDVHGHMAGDVVLQTLARRMLARIRADDVLVRFGGDEFVVIAFDVPDAASIERLKRRLLAACR